MARYLRFAAAVTFTLLAVGFVALWVRSYYRLDSLQVRVSDQNVVAAGGVKGSCFVTKFLSNIDPANWDLYTYDAASVDDSSARNLVSFGIERWGTDNVTIVSPHWFLAASSLGLAALFAFNRTWRYSLRTVLVATTLLAAILGLAVYAV